MLVADLDALDCRDERVPEEPAVPDSVRFVLNAFEV